MGKSSSGSSSAPNYPTTISDSGLWGSSTTNMFGQTYTPAEWQTEAMGTVGTNLNKTLKEAINPSYTGEEYSTLRNELTKQANSTFDNSVLSNVADRGLMRSSGLNSLIKDFGDTLADKELDLMQQYKANKLSDLGTLLDVSNNLYGYSTGQNQLSASLANALANYGMQKYNTDLTNSLRQKQETKSKIGKTAGGAASGAITGASLGPVGAAAGAIIGGATGYLS